MDVEEQDGTVEDDEFIKAKTTAQPLAWLMSRMSFLARHLIVSRPSANANLFTPVSSAFRHSVNSSITDTAHSTLGHSPSWPFSDSLLVSWNT